MADISDIKVELLSREYAALNDRYLLYVKEYKAQFSYIGVYLTAFAGFILYIVNDKVTIGSPFLYSVTLYVSIFLAYSVSANLFDSLYEIYLVQARMSAIEQKINNYVNDQQLYVFEQKILLRSFHYTKYRLTKWTINPPQVWAFWTFLFFSGIAVIHCSIYFKLLTHEIGLCRAYYIFVSLFTLFTLSQWIGLTRAIDSTRRAVFKASGIDLSEKNDKISVKD